MAVNLALNKSYTVSPSPSGFYPDVNGLELTNGVLPSLSSYTDGGWTGWGSTNVTLRIDLGSSKKFDLAKIYFISDNGAGIYVPASVEIQGSNDDSSYTTLATENPSDVDGWASFAITESTYRYIKLICTRGTGHEWMFIGEVEIYYTPIELTSSISAVSNVSGKSTLLALKDYGFGQYGKGKYGVAPIATNNLSGEINAASNVSGGLTVTKLLVGIIGGGSNVSGSLTKLVPLQGDVSAVNEMSGQLTKEINLAGSITAASAVNAELNNQAIINLVGSIQAQSSVEGAILKTISLQGEAAAASSLMASISLYKILAGQVRGSTDVSGFLTKYVDLVGSIEGQANISTDLTVVTVFVTEISGEIGATSSVSGLLTNVIPDFILAGEFEDEITLAGSFETGITLAGSMETGISLKGDFAVAEKEQDFEMWAGEDKTFTIPITSVTTISEASWILAEKVKYNDLITKTSEVGGGLVINGTNLIITLEPDDTEELDGNYYHEARITDSNGKTETVAVGTATINRTAHDN